ncbi:penicillin-binding protein 1A [Pseudoxanthomonas sp. X-1]|uniref:penicillin-binding protein 1A n=1 Tax=Pseudoxanthomonas sp. X-1 TaxID=2571115 RepID=UPI00110BEE3B|nr:penicillin-binding protein 1A [Pseudoxanthomonas sp. X-1]TMN17694.1 penicillin-binding protein 1A [Pseudoxanthomonas sp. X-1]UAY75871.1 penicillin-binding protein 1A [Pseudoxanthomonas sp. X-1]
MSRFRRLLRWALLLCLAGALAGAVILGFFYYSISSKLPSIQSLRDVQLQEPMYVYANDGSLIGIFGETRRYPVDISKVPVNVQRAFVAAEDSNFYEHGGIDPTGISRAVWQTLTKDGRVAGGSTITQQVARQFFLSNEYSYTRKLAEMLLAMRIERMLTKDQILELYLNKSFFGNRSYGVAAAAEFYYGKTLDQLTLGEAATLVSSLKFPSSGNPISNPVRNHQRSVYVIDRMLEDHYISASDAAAAKAEPPHAAPHERPIDVYAPYVAEMVRQEMVSRFGGEVLDKGYHVTTTVDPLLQPAADQAVRTGLATYDHRHGWRGAEKHFEVTGDADAESLAAHLTGIVSEGGLDPVIVASTSGDSATVVTRDAQQIVLGPSASRWTGKTPGRLLQRGDLVRIGAERKDKDAEDKTRPMTEAKPEYVYTLDQLPQAQSALVSLDANSGAIRALVGGFSFAANKFNRATQARRQPGSSFKPFLYSAAFEKGFNPLSIVLDAPVVFRDRRGHVWRPGNDDGKFDGPMRLREALVKSKNLVSVRLLDAIGVDFARKFIAQFGFDEAELPPNLSMALGSASLTPMSVARGYAVLANGGSLVTPWLIDEVKDRDGKVVFKENPAVACRSCGRHGANAPAPSQVVDGFNFGPAQDPQAKAEPLATSKAEPADEQAPPPGTNVAPRAIDERTAYQLVSMMRDVVQRGTGTAAKVLGRADTAGKTGSTNDHRDAWFSGFAGPYVTTVWVGKDNFRSLGYREYGGKAALPIWIDYMRVALKDKPITPNDPPEGMVQVSRNGATEWIKVEDLERMQGEDSLQDQNATDEAAFDIF